MINNFRPKFARATSATRAGLRAANNALQAPPPPLPLSLNQASNGTASSSHSSGLAGATGSGPRAAHLGASHFAPGNGNLLRGFGAAAAAA